MADKKQNIVLEDKHIETLTNRIEQLIIESRNRIASTINTTMVYTYYEIGRYIVEDEQGGDVRAKYGKAVLKGVSKRLTERLGKGWSVDTLEKTRNFYQCFSKSATPSRILETTRFTLDKSATLSRISLDSENKSYKNRYFVLSWNHYLILSHIQDSKIRDFYEIEAFTQQWSKRRLQREIGSSLYERLALSRNKNEIMRLSQEGQTIEKPTDIIKDPLVLEFIGLKPDISYSETKLESALINKLQNFLLEMGKGFLFEARQKRFSFEERHFYVDLVLYNRLLQCYVLIDLKMDDITHQDLGQMQMYVNFICHLIPCG